MSTEPSREDYEYKVWEDDTGWRWQVRKMNGIPSFYTFGAAPSAKYATECALDAIDRKVEMSVIAKGRIEAEDSAPWTPASIVSPPGI